MSRHSKNCTSNAIFTNSEKLKLKHEYGTISQRIGSESQAQFLDCLLCLQRARDPVLCGKQAHTFCQECILENLLMQKKAAERNLAVWKQ